MLAGPLLAGCLGGEGSDSGTSGNTETAETTTTAATTTATPDSTAPTTDGTRSSRATTETGSPSSASSTESAESAEPPESPELTTPNGTRTSDSPTRSPTEGTAATDTGEPSAIAERRITVGDRACGTAIDEGTIRFESERVVVTGTITGSDSCATAVLDAAAYDREAKELRIVVTSETERETGRTCAQCLTEIEYEATVRFEGERPGTAVLVHRGATDETRVETATA